MIEMASLDMLFLIRFRKVSHQVPELRGTILSKSLARAASRFFAGKGIVS